MNDDATSSSTALPSTISGIATIHVIDQELIPWALYNLSGARTPDSLETMQDYFWRFRVLRGKILDGIAYGALQKSWYAFIRRWNRMLEDSRSFLCGSPIEKTFTPIIPSVSFKSRYEKTLGTEIDSALSTSTKGVARVIRCHVHLAKNGNGISLNVHSANVSERRSGSTSAVSMNEGSQSRVAHRAGIIALDN